jgi:predicted dehydrogenase
MTAKERNTLRLGVVGVCFFGLSQLRNAAPLSGVAVTALADTDPDRLQSVAEEFDVDATHESAEALFASPEVDAVVLAVPNHLHAAFTVQALEAGKHVLVEKPLARDVEEAGAMIAARDRADRVLMVSMNQRFQPAVPALREIISRRELGPISHVRAQWTPRRVWEGLWQRGEWGLDPELAGGGPLLDLGVHKLDLALHLLDFPEVESVTGTCTYGIGKAIGEKRGRDYRVEDSAIGLLRHADGSSLLLHAAYFLSGPDADRNEILIHCDNGYVRNDEAFGVDDEGNVSSHPLPEVRGPNTALEHFCRVVRGESQLMATAEQGLQTLRIVQGIYESARTGRQVDL